MNNIMKAKGGTIKDVPAFIKEKFGEEKYNEWFAALPPESQKIYSNQILPSVWYPFEFASKIPTETIIKLFYGGDPKKGEEIGEWFADKILTGVYRAFMKVTSDNIVVTKASSMLSTFYRPAKLEIPESGTNYAIIRFTEFPEMFETMEYITLGFTKKTLKIAGAKNVVVKINKSLTKGDPYTEYEEHWE